MNSKIIGVIFKRKEWELIAIQILHKESFRVPIKYEID